REPHDERKDDAAIDDALAAEVDVRLFVDERLVEVQLGGVEHEVREHHVLRLRDRSPARMHEHVSDGEILEVVVVARDLVAHASPWSRRLAMTSYWISLVPSKMRKTRASRQNLCAGYSREYP